MEPLECLSALFLGLGCYGESPPLLMGRDITQLPRVSLGSGSEPDLRKLSIEGPPCAPTIALGPGQQDATLDGRAGSKAKYGGRVGSNWAVNIVIQGEK